MTTRRLIVVIIALFLLWIDTTRSPDPESSSVSPGETVLDGENRVVKVVDGDTIKVQIDGKQETVRLIGVDTPETVDPRKPVQCFGKAASQKTTELLLNQEIRLESDATQDDRDKYKRLLRYVFLLDGTHVNELLIREGYAHEYTYDVPYQYQAQFKEAELLAREGNKGLWAPDAC